MSIFTSQKSTKGTSQGGSSEEFRLLLPVPANIDGFSKMLLWLTFGACFFSSKGDLNLGLFLGTPFEVDFELVLGPKKVPKRARRSRFTTFFFVGRRFGAKTHRTFQGKSPTGRFRGTAPQDVSANIYRKLRKYPETLRELDLTISLHRAPGNQW